MKQINWCLEVKNGIELVKPNETLSKAFLIKSENSLKAARSLKNNLEWEVTSSYYTMYFALYAVLMKLGIKCEIHACTIEFMKEFLQDYFTKEDYKLLKQYMKTRIDVQYYSNKKVLQKDYQKTIKFAPRFLIKCKEILLTLNEKQIKEIRIKVHKNRKKQIIAAS